VFLVDDHDIFRMGLRAALRDAPDIEVAGEAGNGPSLLDRIQAAGPDLVLLDVHQGQPGAFDTLEAIKGRFPLMKVVAMTGDDTRIPAADAFSHQIDGYIKKECSGDFLCTALKMVALGGSVWQHELLYTPAEADRHASELTSKGLNGAAARLSPRERQLLSLLAGGKTNKQMGLELKLAQVTVKKALQTLFTKLGVSNRTQAAVKASQLGLV
jgi:DNA-binding NarL/FixJ family response regulator